MGEHLDESDIEGEVIYLVGGDKCGSVHLFKIEKLKSHWLDENKPEEGDESLNLLNHLSLIKPMQSILNMTKDNAAVSSIYSKKIEANKYSMVCCCQDGFYRVLEFDLGYTSGETPDVGDTGDHDMDEDVEMTVLSDDNADEDERGKTSQTTSCLLKMVNKYQINSYIDLIESFIFDDDNHDDGDDESNQRANFDLEKSLKLALCFYGDKFLLWSFHLTRSLFEFRCGGANRSWDYEFQVFLPTFLLDLK